MWKLVQYEYKKIFKSKINILLVIAVLGGCLYMAVDQVNKHFIHTSYENENGQSLSSVEIFQFMDEFQREHAGEIDDNYLKELDIYYKNVVKENKNDGYDEDWMIESYGKDYKQFLKKLDDNAMSEEEVHQYLYEIDTNNRIPSVSFEKDHWIYETKSKHRDYEKLLYDQFN